MEIIRVSQTASTNSLIKEIKAAHATVLVADCQTAGRGQRGNSWEAEPGANLTFSIMLKRGDLRADRQFIVSCAIALAIVEALDDLLPLRDDITVKWPNDIYVGDKKICGILIENSLTGAYVSSSIAGIGINVNQICFLSNAPNPVSMKQLTGMHYSLPDLLERICLRIIERFELATDDVVRQYKCRLWRREGFHRYIDVASGKNFLARIADVEPSGHLILETMEGQQRRYAFKEVTPVL